SWKARSFSGLHGAIPRRWNELGARGGLLRPTVLSAMAVRYVSLAPGIRFDSTAVETVRQEGAALPVLQVKRALPRAYAVPLVAALGGDDQVLDALLASTYGPTAVAFTTDAAAAGAYPGSRSCRVRWIEDEPDRLKLAVDAPERAFLVIAD